MAILRKGLVCLVFATAAGLSLPASAQQACGSQMPPDQATPATAAPNTTLQPSEIQEQQIEQQQQTPPPPGG